MTKPCSRIQNTLAEHGPTAFQNNSADQAHLAECDACFAFMEALGQLDGELAGFPKEEPSDALIQQTLLAVSANQTSEASPKTAKESDGAANAGNGIEDQKTSSLGSRLAAFWHGLKLSTLNSAHRNKLLITGGAAFSVILLVVIIQPQYFPPGAILDRTEALREPLAAEEKGTLEQLREHQGPSPAQPINEELDNDTSFLDKQVTAPGLDNKIGLSRNFKKDAEEKNKPNTPKLGDQPAGDGYMGGLKSRRVPLPDEDVSKLQSELNRPLKEKAKHPAKPDPTSGGRFRQDDPSVPQAPAREMADRAKTDERVVGNKKSARRENHESSNDRQEQVVQEMLIAPTSQTSQVPTPTLLDTFTESRENKFDNEAGKKAEIAEPEPVMEAEYEIGIPDPPPVQERDGVARVGQVAVTPPVFIKKAIPAYPKEAEKIGLQGYVILEAVFGANGVISQVRVLRGLGKGKFGFEEAAVAALKKYSYVPGKVHGKPAAVRMTVKIDFVLGQKASGMQPTEEPLRDPTTREHRLAESFLQHYRATEHLQFQDATGYWANTYIPGDPYLKLLSKRLAAFDRSAMAQRIGGPVNLEREADSYSQPFDPPENAALGLHLHTNLARISEPSRVILQVGLQAADRSGGMRSAMNLGLVLDLTESLSKPTLTKLGLLLDTFLAARERSDQFSLTVAGRPGGILLPPDQFRHGPLLLAKKSLLAENHQVETQGFTLEEAIRTAGAQVARGLDETAPLGSSALIVITARSLNSLDQLLTPIHELAVAGIPTSAIGVGSKADLAQLDQLVLAGQGNRRVMNEVGDEKRIVAKELNAVSRVIARAIRLRLRLAPGVRLIEVLGSQKLDTDHAQKVRQAEKSIDLHLGRSLGIQADRGEDEEGIQIVIPQFHGGDSHVILLDLWVPGPGKIADGQIRYKDLVYLRNGIARAHHSLSRHGLPEGPLQRQVTKNLIGYEISRNLRTAARHLARGHLHLATEQVLATQALLRGLRDLLPAVMRDGEFQKDNRMLAQYATAMEPGAMERKPWRNHLSESLAYASYVKLLPGIGKE